MDDVQTNHSLGKHNIITNSTFRLLRTRLDRNKKVAIVPKKHVESYKYLF